MSDFGLSQLQGLALLADARTRSISPENVDGAKGGGYRSYTTPYLGLPQVIAPDGFERSQQRFGMYRWHVPDPIRFDSDLRVTVQALGWRSPLGGKPRYLPLQDDLASTVLWYQAEPHAPFPALPGANALEVV